MFLPVPVCPVTLMVSEAGGVGVAATSRVGNGRARGETAAGQTAEGATLVAQRGQPDGDCGSALRAVARFDSAHMALNDRLDDRKSEPRAT